MQFKWWRGTKEIKDLIIIDLEKECKILKTLILENTRKEVERSYDLQLKTIDFPYT